MVMGLAMKKLGLKFKWMFIFIIVEVFSYLRIRPSNLEMFFMVWAFIALALLLSNIFKVNEDNPMPGLGGDDSCNYANLATAFVEKKYNSRKRGKINHGFVFDPINLVFLILLIANIIGYAIILD